MDKAKELSKILDDFKGEYSLTKSEAMNKIFVLFGFVGNDIATPENELMYAKKCWEQGRPLDSVRAVRRATGLSLMDAKLYCEKTFNKNV